MADIFLSYSKHDRPRAELVAKTLEEFGWDVFWDRQIIPGDDFEEFIQRELKAAWCVVVLWSPAAVQSNWVRNEAAYGEDRGILVPARIAKVDLPLALRHRHAADLIEWDGSSDAQAFGELVRGIAAKADLPSQPELLTEAPKREEPEVILQGLRQRLASAPALRELRRLEHEAAEHSKRHPSADATEFLKVVQAALHLEEALQERPP